MVAPRRRLGTPVSPDRERDAGPRGAHGVASSANAQHGPLMQHWYVVHSKPRQETLAVEHLERQGFEVWLPRAAVTRRLRGQWVERVEPLFPRYLFLHADVAVTDISPVRSTRGCATVVRMAGRPAVVPDAVVEWLQATADPESGLHRIGRSVRARLQAGEKVRVIEGPFAGAEGLLEALKGEERAVVLLKVLAESARVTLPTAQLASVAGHRS